MAKDHLKRIAAPRSWPLLRKERTFITRPKPGRGFSLAAPFSQVMKVLLRKGNTTKEVRYILKHEDVLVNGKRVHDFRRPVGFMDVISFPSIKEHYVMSLSERGVLCTVAIDAKQADSRLVKVANKTRLAGKIQVNCDDGTNIVVDKDSYRPGDSLLVKGGKVAKHLPLQAGATIMLTGGNHLAKVGTVDEVEGRTIIFTTEDGTHSTARKYAFVIGGKEPEVTVR